MGEAGESVSAKLARHPGIELASAGVPTAPFTLFEIEHFLDRTSCRALIALIEADHHPSSLADGNGDASFRTSQTCDLDPREEVVIGLEKQLLALNGIAPDRGEPIQGQRYRKGERFKPHTDYFTPDGLDYRKFCAGAGQRSWTFMIYLNEVERGGATRFEAIDVEIEPRTGKLLCWNNLRDDSSVNPATLHEGCTVERGTKYLVTKWYREKRWRG